ncbi:MAG: Asp-tRNA(Asn)/Glu-tRNA(Gln) amidotransferase subunit GatB [Actinobacteria bacterium]|nr:Asp-tRNA(Asn)/Glu-tRNA(Gln) amidotransferase subunit GatB [Actinomycetota bacterium]
MAEWEAVIGIETHVELQTKSKMFCGCAVAFGEAPNTNTCPVCLALPGAIPVPNEEAIEGIVKIGTALDSTINKDSLFYRKNYFYPDLPKNYQISQYTFPVCEFGKLDIMVDGEPFTVGITRVHMEEDTGKSRHVGEGGRIHDASHSLLDFNRSGVPLVEVVTEPDIRTAEQARAYGAELQRIVRTLGVSDARLEEGSMRFDANVSVRRGPDAEFGTRTETKNVNSLRSLQRAITFEIDRQIRVLEEGGEIIQETRHWNEGKGVTISMRIKEESEDYRYFQEPDMLPLEIDEEWQQRVKANQPELPAQKRARYVGLGTDTHTAELLADDPALGGLFDEAVGAGADAKQAGIWLTQEVVAYLRREEKTLSATALSAEHVAELATMVAAGDLSSTASKDVLNGVLAGEGTPREIAESRDLIQISDSGFLDTEVDAVIADNAGAFEKLVAGDMKMIGFFVGQVMKRTGGKADPRLVSEMVRTKVQG